MRRTCGTRLRGSTRWKGSATRSGTGPGSEYGQRPASTASTSRRKTGVTCSREGKKGSVNGRRLPDRPAAEQRGCWLAGQRAGAFCQLHDDRVLVECGPDQAVLQRHLGACV